MNSSCCGTKSLKLLFMSAKSKSHLSTLETLKRSQNFLKRRKWNMAFSSNIHCMTKNHLYDFIRLLKEQEAFFFSSVRLLNLPIPVETQFEILGLIFLRSLIYFKGQRNFVLETTVTKWKQVQEVFFPLVFHSTRSEYTYNFHSSLTNLCQL